MFSFLTRMRLTGNVRETPRIEARPSNAGLLASPRHLRFLSAASSSSTALALRSAAAGRVAGVPSMLSLAITRLIELLQQYLPSVAPADSFPPSSVSLASADEKELGIGQWEGLGQRNEFPVARKGVRVAAVTRFQLWGNKPESVEQKISDLTSAILADRELLRDAGFVELRLKSVTVADLPTADNWRQIAEFDVLFEFRFEDTDGAGGLIARIPSKLQAEFGDMLLSGDLTIWDETAAPTLEVAGAAAPITGLASLEFLPATPTGSVTITRTFDGAAGAPAPSPSFNQFLSDTAGPNPVTNHASFLFADFTAFTTALGATVPAGAMDFADLSGTPRSFAPRSFPFVLPIELPSRSDRLLLRFGADHLGPGQIFYLRVSRGQSK